MKKELDELKIYQNMSKIDKMKATYHKPPQKWYLEKRMDAFNIKKLFYLRIINNIIQNINIIIILF